MSFSNYVNLFWKKAQPFLKKTKNQPSCPTNDHRQKITNLFRNDDCFQMRTGWWAWMVCVASRGTGYVDWLVRAPPSNGRPASPLDFTHIASLHCLTAWMGPLFQCEIYIPTQVNYSTMRESRILEGFCLQISIYFYFKGFNDVLFW